MKQIIIILMIVAVAMTSFAQTDQKTMAKKPSLAIQKKLQFFKIMATEEKKILDRYIICLNTVDTDKGIQVCNNKRREMIGKLRQRASLVNNNNAKKGAMNRKQAPIKKK
ncbi:MAG: hypothetical protein C0603_03625 [Denitrovibrio sp.]|nr:MAG: hypothetical protein C0603_03625 [Denitrovibrio sp.]